MQDRLAIREADAADMPALMRLAQLDSRPLPQGNLLVAETDGGIRAALSVDDQSLIADPFTPTTELQQLLVLRANQLTNNRRRRRAPLRDVLGLRPHPAG